MCVCVDKAILAPSLAAYSKPIPSGKEDDWYPCISRSPGTMPGSQQVDRSTLPPWEHLAQTEGQLDTSSRG